MISDYKAPWWRRDVILTAEEKQRMKEQQIILFIICCMVVAMFGLYQLIRHVEKEATIKEQNRIYKMATENSLKMQEFIDEMERAGRGKSK